MSKIYFPVTLTAIIKKSIYKTVFRERGLYLLGYLWELRGGNDCSL